MEEYQRSGARLVGVRRAGAGSWVQALLFALFVVLSGAGRGLAGGTATAPLPTISSFTPGAGSGGTQVVITGTSFTDVTAVAFQGSPAAQFFVASQTRIVATAPPDVATGRITVTTPGGTTTSDSIFQVLPPPLLEVLDANPACLNQPRTGAVADGATELYLRLTASEPGTVSFDVTNRLPGDTLHRVGSIDAATDVPTELVQGSNVATALYTVPPELAPNDPDGVQDLTFSATYTAAGGSDPVTSIAPLRLERPPVVLVHGIWSSGATWFNSTGTRARLLAAPFHQFKPYVVDYHRTNASHIEVNKLVVLDGVDQAYRALRANKVAVTRVDVVGHSMGGLLARRLVRWDRYRNPNNFGAGYIRRLITIGTPHLGSELATILRDLVVGGHRPYSRFLASQMAARGCPVDQGAVEDLSIGSRALANLQETVVPSYAIRGVYAARPPASSNEALVVSLLHWFGYDNVFRGRPNDGLVPASSQQGGISAGFYSSPAFSSVYHTTETASAAIGAKVVSLLEGSQRGFAPGFPAPAWPIQRSSRRDAPPPMAKAQTLLMRVTGCVWQ